MKILDKYVIKNFLIGYIISFTVLIGLRVMIDLFINIDEFAENIGDYSFMEVSFSILTFYGAQVALYFKEFAGFIIVIAAVFSLSRMTKNNELTAIMASGVSLKRVIAPIVVVTILLSGLQIIDQEMIIPKLKKHLVRSHDDMPGDRTYQVRFMSDINKSLIYSNEYIEKEEKFIHPNIVIIENNEQGEPTTKGIITADTAVYNNDTKQWDLTNGKFLKKTDPGRITEEESASRIKDVNSYKNDIKPEDIPIRMSSDTLTLLSSKELTRLAQQETQSRDKADLYAQKHFRFIDPLINILMLMISLPVLVCRDPKGMKSAILVSFLLTIMCWIILFACHMLAGEVIFGKIQPALWAWIPILLFTPIATLQIDAMKT